MLRPRNVIRLSTKNFSCWRNSITAFGRQILQIQNGNGCQSHCNIPFKPQQLFQCYQFSNGNEGFQHQQRSGRTEKRNIDNEMRLETRFLGLDNFHSKVLKLKIQTGKSGNKIFRIEKLNKIDIHNSYNFNNIPVPEDSYAFVRTLDELIAKLASKDFEQKLDIQVVNHGYKTKRRFKLRTVEHNGLFHKFQLELLLFVNTDNEKIHKEICLGLCSVNKTNMNKRMLNLPLKALPWLRNQMAEMLAKYDGTEAILLEAPAKIPQKYFQIQMMNEGGME